GRADHRSGGMAARAARIEPFDRRGVRHALVEAEGVVDVMNVAKADAEMLLDFPGREGKDIDDAVFKAGSELLSDGQEMIDVMRLFVFPRLATGKLIRHPLNK